MKTLDAISERMNQIATDTQQEFDAESVVVMTLVRKTDGLELAIGSTGTTVAMQALVDYMPLIADALREVSASESTSMGDPNAN